MDCPPTSPPRQADSAESHPQIMGFSWCAHNRVYSEGYAIVGAAPGNGLLLPIGVDFWGERVGLESGEVLGSVCMPWRPWNPDGEDCSGSPWIACGMPFSVDSSACFRAEFRDSRASLPLAGRNHSLRVSWGRKAPLPAQVQARPGHRRADPGNARVLASSGLLGTLRTPWEPCIPQTPNRHADSMDAGHSGVSPDSSHSNAGRGVHGLTVGRGIRGLLAPHGSLRIP